MVERLVPEWGCDVEGCTELWTHEVRYLATVVASYGTARIGIAVFRCAGHKDDVPEPDDRYLSFQYDSTRVR